MKMRKNKLDEMQEKKLLQIEHNGVWLAFWGLLISMGVQMLIYHGESTAKTLAGEWTVFMVLALYLAISCVRHNIWDRTLSPTPKVNLLCSLVAGVVMGVLYFILSYLNYGKLLGSVATGVIMFIGVFVLCFAALSVTAAIYKKRVANAENAPETDTPAK
ncbi:MAG: hypothetical protein PHG02_00405 [Oscillospiraceae bacterium]|nr:hypothetical protein [Oscillospiraceae bacterium]